MWIFGRKGPSGFSACSTAEQVTQGVDGTGLTAIITGASGGIGAETSRVFALRGVHVVMAVRNIESGAKVKESIIKQIPNAKIDVMELDISSMGSVRKFAEDFKSLNLPLNLLINNAGIMAGPFTLSRDNVELQFATNHLGHFLLTNLLLETMKSTARESHREGRIVNISSSAHTYTDKELMHFDDINDESGYNAGSSYSLSKLANILHTNELTKHFKEEGVEITANSVHPGTVGTNLMRNLGYIYVFINWVGNYILKNPQQGAATTCYVALHPQVKGVSGEYFADSNVSERSILAKDDVLAKKLWDFSLSLTESM